MDSNHRPSGYEPDELPLLHAAIMKTHSCIDLVSQGVIPPVPLALRRCTTRFGMGRGGSSALHTHLCVLLSARYRLSLLCFDMLENHCSCRSSGFRSTARSRAVLSQV